VALPPWLLYAFLFVLGTIIGSFLNVVVYRLPREISLSYPESRCPSCGKSIRWYHNVPVLGWVGLRGRCADCGSKISPRYPLVEALVGAMFVAIALVDLQWRTQALDDGSSIATLDPAELLPYARDLILLCALFACACIQLDGHRPPMGLLGWCVTLLVFTWALQIVFAGFSYYAIQWSSAPESVLLGLFAGLLLGVVLAWSTAAVDRRALRGQIILATILIGAAVGPHGVVLIATITSLAQLVESIVCLLKGGDRRLCVFTWLFVCTVVWMLAAQPLTLLLTSWDPWLPIALGCLVTLWAMLAALVDLQYHHEKPPA